MRKKLSVAFLWHMHQPLYKDLVTGKYQLPWVRMHSTFSYLDMISVIEASPKAKATFNLTPSLIWQLFDMSGEGPIDDIYLELSEKKATDLDDDDKCFILKNFFSCDLQKGIFPFKRYKELYYKRGESLRENDLKSKLEHFNAGDFRDLQVLFNLAWCGFTLRKKCPIVKSLISKGYGFTEDEKQALLKRQKEVVASIIPKYKKLQDEGRIEITTTPFYHPILPLLYRGASEKGLDLCEDARVQVKKAVEFYENVFGRKPIGMWPSEGSVSQEIIPMLVDEGIEWMATDEGILLESFKGKGLSREDLIYNAFTACEDGKKIDVVFRDINISNAISFSYSNMPQRKAVASFLKDINGIRKAMASSEDENVVSIILDGENPWPYFPDGGKYFLNKLYKKLSTCKDIELVTVGDYLRANEKRREIDRLHSGSWIDRNFDKWIGSPQKDKAWEYLEDARREVFASGEPDKKVLEQLYVAEGSDWFWWYDDFGSEVNFVFDELYRLHLSNIYRFMGRNVPHHLDVPIHTGSTVQELPEKATPAMMGRFPRVLIASSEVFPFAKTGGLADVAGSLPKALASLGCDARVIMPLYKCVKESGIKLTREARNVKCPVKDGMHGFDLYSHRAEGVTTYFVEQDRCFDRDGLYGTPKGDYPDNGLRFGFFSRAVLGAIKAVDFTPDIIHCNDWQSAFIPFYLRFKLSDDDFYKGIRTLFTIHNMAYQGVFKKKIMRKLGVPESLFNMDNLEYHGKLNFMKSGILYSDAVSTVSKRYAEEIMTPYYGCGLDGLLRTRKNVLYGIPNGVDYSVWSPKNDHFIKTNYEAGTIGKKKECKKDLLDYTKLPLPPEAPLLGCVTRLAHQKGIDLLAGIIDRIVPLGAGIIILGSGEKRYNELFRDLMRKYPGNVFVCNDFNDELAHKIEAGCDIFLMPSRYEPCGLNQMYSIKYGTIPVVRATGGLDDVIVDFDENREEGNGFKFGPATQDAFYEAVKRAIEVYGDGESWEKLVLRAMSYDFSWDHSAGQYLKLYRKLMS
ncbi:glycogen synthase GlgA [Candidatus Omnitrophota bacterium]